MFNVTRYIKQLVLSEFREYLCNDMTAGNAEDLLRNLSKKWSIQLTITRK